VNKETPLEKWKREATYRAKDVTRPTRDDVRVEAWQERDRLGIYVTDNRNEKTIIEWWDDNAREMFEQGWFKPGVPQYSWEKPTPEFVNSVLEYCEHIGVLRK